MKRKLLLAIAAAFCGIGEPVALAQPQELEPIYTLEEGKPTKERIEQFLEGGVRLGGGAFEFLQDGTAHYSNMAPGGSSDYIQCRCEKPAPYTVDEKSIRFTCQYKCQTAPSTGITGEQPRLVSLKPKKFLLKALFASRQALAVRDQDGERWLFDNCSPLDEPQPLLSRHCGGLPAGSITPFVELIPGSDDRALLASVREKLRFIRQPYRCEYAGGPTEICFADFFEGAPASTPRATTEIFYANSETMRIRAGELAEYLRPTVGHVVPKLWPGRWDYDVVVVVGSTLLQEGATAKDTGTPASQRSAGP